MCLWDSNVVKIHNYSVSQIVLGVGSHMMSILIFSQITLTEGKVVIQKPRMLKNPRISLV